MHEYRVKQKLNPDTETVVNGNMAFVFYLYGGLRRTEGNLFFSPYSISTALAMTYAGARGDTEKQMAQTLCFTLSQERLHPAFASLQSRLNAVQEKGQIRLSVANSLWPQESYAFLEAFLSLAKEHYGVLITAVDYRTGHEAARLKINAWVEEKTENKIKELIKPGILDPLTRLVLVNAIYFKGEWASQFDKQLTKEALFWVTPDVEVDVSMMTQTWKFRYAEEGGLQILELPYAGDDLSMIVLLPKKVDGLAELQDALSAESLNKWIEHLERTEVVVHLPRFKMSFEIRLDTTLVGMGMTDAFDQRRANFAGMDGREDWLCIGAVLHKAFVEVNEEGTEAAAATAVVMKGRSVSRPPLVFRADHPFVFVILDNLTRSILFLGRVVNPIAS